VKPANYAPIYAGLYPELAEVARKHGYALAVHGSMARDFDVIAIPWTNEAGDPQLIVDEILDTFALEEVGEMDVVEHGRKRWLIKLSYGACQFDFSAMPRMDQR